MPGDQRAHFARIAFALFAGACVGVAGIDDDRAKLAAGNVLSADLDRSGEDAIGGEHGGGGGGRVAEKNSDVGRLLGFDARVNAPARKPRGDNKWNSGIRAFCSAGILPVFNIEEQAGCLCYKKSISAIQ